MERPKVGPSPAHSCYGPSSLSPVPEAFFLASCNFTCASFIAALNCLDRSFLTSGLSLADFNLRTIAFALATAILAALMSASRANMEAELVAAGAAAAAVFFVANLVRLLVRFYCRTIGYGSYHDWHSGAIQN